MAVCIAVCTSIASAITQVIAQLSIVLSQIIPYAGIAFLLICGAWAFERISDCNTRKNKAEMITRITEYQAITAMMRDEKPGIPECRKPVIEIEQPKEPDKLPAIINFLDGNGWK